MLHLLLLLLSQELSSLSTIPCGTFDISSTDSPVRLLSHERFNMKTRYGNNAVCSWAVELGSDCLEQKVWCVFLKTKANKKCTLGDVLKVSGTPVAGRKTVKRYCGSSRPTAKRPLVLQTTAKIKWKTNKRTTSQGFDCRVVCTKRM